MEGRGGAAQGGGHGVGGDGFEDPFQEAGRSGRGSSVCDTVSLCGDDADAAGGWLCFVQSILPRLREFLTIRLPRISAMAYGALRAVFDPNSAARLEKEAVEEILLASVEHVEGTPTDSRELSLAFVETVDAGLALLQDQDRTLSLETLSCILPCLLKQVRSTTGRERRANARPLYSVAFRASRIVSLNARCAFSRDSFTLSVSDPLRHFGLQQLQGLYLFGTSNHTNSCQVVSETLFEELSGLIQCELSRGVEQEGVTSGELRCEGLRSFLQNSNPLCCVFELTLEDDTVSLPRIKTSSTCSPRHLRQLNTSRQSNAATCPLGQPLKR